MMRTRVLPVAIVTVLAMLTAATMLSGAFAPPSRGAADTPAVTIAPAGSPMFVTDETERLLIQVVDGMYP